MTKARQSRQHERHAIDLGVQLSIENESEAQVAPLIGRQVEARLANLSAGGARAIVRTYLPRGTSIDVHVPAVADLAPRALHAQIVSTEMVDHTPRYALGLRWQTDPGPLVQRMEQVDPGMPDAERPVSPATADIPPDRPEWMRSLLRDGLARRTVLDQAWQETRGDDGAAAEWLVRENHVTQGDISLAQAAALKMPYVEVGGYRLANTNHELIREEMARAHSVFPMFVLEHIITVAVARPLDLAVLDQIRLQTGSEVDQCLTTPRELQQLINWAYGGFSETTDTASTQETNWLSGLDEVSDAPAVKLVDVLLDRAVSSRASDIHIDAEENRLRVRFRVDGVLREVPAPPRSMLPAIVSRIKILSHLNIAETRRPQDGHFKLAAEQEELDIRVSTLPSAGGEAVVMRLLHSGARLLSLEELGMTHDSLDVFEQLLQLPHGMLLVTGPTGSGKTTTLYSGLSHLDRVRRSIITLEDPVEIRLHQVRQVSVNPKAGLTFEAGLRAILRQDPDTIMLGEIRDRETAETALQAALTGHVVLSTLHTNSAAAAPNRLLDMGVPDFLVASALTGVLAQRLCRRLCGRCARPAAELPAGIAAVADELLGDIQTLEAVGCNHCGNTGYDGRVGVFEMMVVSDEIRRAILDRRDDQTIAAMARRNGTRPLVEDGIEKVRRGQTSIAELVRVVGHIYGFAKSPGRGATHRRTHVPANNDFDVNGYERLLKQWLQRDAVETVAAPEHN